jgi:hypothetical protein
MPSSMAHLTVAIADVFIVLSPVPLGTSTIYIVDIYNARVDSILYSYGI